MAISQKLEIETNAVSRALEAMTAASDGKTFSASFAPFAASLADPVIIPNGIVTGAQCTPTVSTNDSVDIAACTAKHAGNAAANSNNEVTVAAASIGSITRPSSGNKIIHAIVITNAATPVYALTAGTENTSFSTTFGANGGPPHIDVDHILVALIKLDGDAAAQITQAEIRQFPDDTSDAVSQERYDFPTYKDPLDDLTNSVDGKVVFERALVACHTGDVPRKVYVKGHSAIMTRLSNVGTYTPSGLSVSSSSTSTFDGATASQTTGVTDGSFELPSMLDGIRDAVVSQEGKRVLVRYYQDEFSSNYIWDQGLLAVSRTFESQANPTSTCTIAARSKAVSKTS